jgi:hypothetical protein
MQPATEESSSGLKAIQRSAIRALRRFPGVLLVATIATVLVVHGALTRGFDGEFGHWAALLPCLLGISWLYCLSLIGERRLSAPWKWLMPLLVGALSLGLYYWRIRGVELNGNPIAFVLEYAGLAFALHFFAAYAPFMGFRQPRAFWEYNRRIFLRFLLALLFSGTLWLGMTLFVALLGRLFGNQSFYVVSFILSACILGIFNTWFFLAGVPEDFEALEQNPKPYPRALKFFAQFILLPLVVLIGAVLAILMIQSLAAGRPIEMATAAPILAVGGFGLLTYLLLFPLEEDPQQRWLRIFSKGFFLALLPLLAIIAFLSFRLVQHYGWTPPRYYGLLLTVWGMGLSLYLVLAKRPRISWIPVSLSLIALLTVGGPWSAVALTQRSQNRRMAALLGNSLPIDQSRLLALNQKERAKLESQVVYLERNYGCEELKAYFGDLLQARHNEDAGCSSMDVLRLLRRDPALPAEDLKEIVVNINFLERGSPGVLNTQGYDLYFPSSTIRFLEPGQKAAECPTHDGAEPLCVTREVESYRIEIFRSGKSLGGIDVEPMVQALLKKESAAAEKGSDPYYRTYDLTRPGLSFETKIGGKPARLDFEHIRLEQRGQRVSPEYLRFSLLFQEGS